MLLPHFQALHLTFIYFLNVPYSGTKRKHTYTIFFPITVTSPKSFSWFYWYISYTHGFQHEIFTHTYNYFDHIHPITHHTLSHSCWSLLSSYLSSSFFHIVYFFFDPTSFTRVVSRSIEGLYRTMSILTLAIPLNKKCLSLSQQLLTAHKFHEEAESCERLPSPLLDVSGSTQPDPVSL